MERGCLAFCIFIPFFVPLTLHSVQDIKFYYSINATMELHSWTLPSIKYILSIVSQSYIVYQKILKIFPELRWLVSKIHILYFGRVKNESFVFQVFSVFNPSSFNFISKPVMFSLYFLLGWIIWISNRKKIKQRKFKDGKSGSFELESCWIRAKKRWKIWNRRVNHRIKKTSRNKSSWPR